MLMINFIKETIKNANAIDMTSDTMREVLD